ncbi:MAG: hypothetical protein LBJ08_12865 [Bifidobacteriaceae bacterium]|nr:hypothetical protein [Bifidobacteriaceae bacterium]
MGLLRPGDGIVQWSGHTRSQVEELIPFVHAVLTQVALKPTDVRLIALGHARVRSAAGPRSPGWRVRCGYRALPDTGRTRQVDVAGCLLSNPAADEVEAPSAVLSLDEVTLEDDPAPDRALGIDTDKKWVAAAEPTRWRYEVAGKLPALR